MARQKKLKQAQREQESYQAFLALVKLGGILRKAGDRFFRVHGLTQTQFNVLMLLKYELSDGCTQTELCRHLLVKGANMTGIVRRLEDRRLIVREPDPEDERAWLVRLTRKGATLLEGVEPRYYRKIDRVMGIHSEGELRRLSTQLARTQEAIALEAV